MQYINVIVDTKTNKINQVFTYKVTPELLPHIKPGILVEVPFGNRKKEGIILKIVRNPSTALMVDKLKFINKIIDPTPIIDDVRLELAEWMSRYYLTSLAKVIFFMVPDVARREVKRSDIAIQGYKDISDTLHVTRYTLHDPKIFGLYDNKKIRIKNYIQLIQKARAKNKGVILLFPDWQANKIYINIIYERFRNDIILLDPYKTKTEFFRSWNELRTGKRTIVIGTRNSIFAPVNNLGLIIVDEPEDFGYKEEQTVHYHVREVSCLLAKLTGANLVFSSNIPQLEDFYWQKLKKIKFLQYSGIRKNLRIYSKIQVIDSSQEKSIIGYQIEQKIIETLDKKQKVLIFTNRKSQGFLCADCGYIFRCPRCNSPLQQQNNILICSQCNHKKNPPAQCPECQGHNLRSFGTSLESIKKELQKLFPNENKIIVATKEIFRYADAKFDLTIIPSWGYLQFSGDFNQKQDIINTIAKLLEISNGKLIIQTDNLEDEFLRNLKKGNLNIIYDRELSERKKYHYPPYCKLVKFIYKNKDSKVAEREIEKLNRKLCVILSETKNLSRMRGLKLVERSFANAQDDKSEVEILGPSETRKLRDKIYWQIVLKIPAKFYPQVNKSLISREKELNLSKYLIDVDPLRLI